MRSDRLLQYLIYLIVLINIYVILGTSFNLLAGYAGVFSIAHAAFYGIGAYVAALLALRLGWGFLSATAAAAVIGACASVLLAIPSLRTKGLYVAITSFGFQIVMYSVFLNWIPVTGGPAGLSGIPHPRILGLVIDSTASFLGLSLVLALGTVLVFWRLANMPFGRALRAIREDEIAAEASGKDVVRFKVIAFAVASCFAAVAGSLYAYFMVFINPYSFPLDESLFILTIVIVGGSGTVLGPIVGAILLVALPEALRFVNLSDTTAASLRQVLYGLLLILFLMFRPQGIVGEGSGKRWRFRWHLRRVLTA